MSRLKENTLLLSVLGKNMVSRIWFRRTKEEEITPPGYSNWKIRPGVANILFVTGGFGFIKG